MVSKDNKDFLKDTGIMAVGSIAGALTDWGVAIAWNSAGLPIVGVGTLHVDDMLLLAVEGGAAYYAHTKKKKDIRNFLLSMFGMTIAIEVVEAIASMMSPAVTAYVRTPQMASQVSKYVVA